MSLKLSDARQAYYDASATVSTLVRTSCFSGIAVAWAILVGDKSPVKYDGNIGLVFLILLSALFLDLLHYFVQASTWGLYNYQMQQQGVELEDSVSPPPWFNTLPIVFWILKTILTLVGIGILGACLWHCIIHPSEKKKPNYHSTALIIE